MHPVHGPLIRRLLRRASAATLISAGVVAALTPSSATAATTKTWYVSASATTDPTCQATSKTRPFQTIAAALACAASGNTVKVGAGTFAGGFTVPAGVLLEGAGASKTTVTDASRLSVPEVTVAPGTGTEIESLGVLGGASGNAGIAAGSGSLTLSAVSVSDTFDPTVMEGAVTLSPTSGPGALTVLDSTIAGNTSQGSGGIAAGSSTGPAVAVTVIDSTISGNSGGTNAGGIGVVDGTLTARDDTISGNAGGNSGGLYVGVLATAMVRDDIIAANQTETASDTDDCTLGSRASVVDGGDNLIGVAGPGTTSDCGFVNATNGDVTGTPSAPLDPHLGSLAANGGPTLTQALLRGSPAIGAERAVDCAASPVSDLDQRGDARAATSRQACDIGAYDTGGKGKVLPVSAKAKSSPTCAKASSSKPFPTLAAALACAQSGDIVKLGAGTFAGGVAVSANVVLEGAGANKTTISNSTNVGPQEIAIAPDVSATIEGLTVSGGAGNNGGVVASSGSLVIQRTAFAGVALTSAPAPVSVDPSSGNGSLTLLDSTISGSSGAYAGGVYVSAPTATPSTPTPPSEALIANSTISNDYGSAFAGGIDLDDAALTLRDSTLTGNTGTYSGGLYVATKGSATVTDALLATNISDTGASSDDCALQTGTTLADGGHNLAGIASPGTTHDCGFSATDGDVTGTPATPLDPDLGPLALSGGTTETQALQSGSPAIGAGDPADCEAAPVSDRDQRGDSRAASTRHACDIGAYDTGGA